MNDKVNHPAHYTAGNIECIEAIKESMTHRAFMGYCKGNVIKYLWRYENKNNPLEDLKKARWYIEKMIDCTAGKRLKEKADIKADIEVKKPDSISITYDPADHYTPGSSIPDSYSYTINANRGVPNNNDGS